MGTNELSTMHHSDDGRKQFPTAGKGCGRKKREKKKTTSSPTGCKGREGEASRSTKYMKREIGKRKKNKKRGIYLINTPPPPRAPTTGVRGVSPANSPPTLSDPPSSHFLNFKV